MTTRIPSHPAAFKARGFLAAVTLTAAALAPAAAFAQTKFVDPTPDELSMTSLPGYPGVAAVVLNKEEITKDDLHFTSHYARIKILSEEGQKYANVELPYVKTTGELDYDGMGNGKSLDDIQGRTIHPDGTIIPFTGKPYLKEIEKTKGIKVQEKVFTLPDVTVGSIIEYRYADRINDYMYESPIWVIQGNLYVKSAHYMWYPTSHDMTDGNTGALIRTITWFPILPKGAEIVHHEMPGGGAQGLPQQTYELTVKDVPPVIEEEYMPPIGNYSFRVYFNYIAETSPQEYWKNNGKAWSKRVNTFATPNSDLKDATQKIIAGATTQDQKLRAIYATVQRFENTNYTRAHEAREDKAQGLGGKITNASDIFNRERGNSTQLTYLFIAMARAAGMQADAMYVPDRSEELFIPQWLTMQQFDYTIAIVNVDGKDMYFDPGERYCPYGHLIWQHTFVQGLRQKGNETVFEQTSGDGYQDNTVSRVANLTMDANGAVTGRIDITYSGAAAIRWRHTALRGDDESLKHSLRTSLENMIPHTLEVKEVTVSNIDNYEQPLKVSYNVKGTVGSWTGKRLVVPVDLFLVNHKATFPHEKREVAVYFDYASLAQDALRINFPSNFSVEAAPPTAKYGFNKLAAYGMSVEPTATNFTTRRQYAVGDFLIPVTDYPQLRTFYSQFETNDQQSIVLKATAPPTTTASTTPAAN